MNAFAFLKNAIKNVKMLKEFTFFNKYSSAIVLL